MKARLFILLCVMLYGAVTWAQDDSEPVTATIVVENKGGEKIRSDLVGLLSANLLEHNITLQVGGEPYLLTISPLYRAYGNPAYGVSTSYFMPFDLKQSPLLQEGYFESVEDNFDPVIQASYLTGVVLYTLGRCDEALPYFDSLNRIPAGYTDTPAERFYTRKSPIFFRGVCALDRGDIEGAITLFEQVAYHGGYGWGTRPEPMPGLINLAWAYIQVDRDAEAFALLDDYVNYLMGPLDQPLAVPNLHRLDALILHAKFHALNSDFDAALGDIATGMRLLERYIPEHGINLAERHDLAKLYFERGQIRMLTYEWDAALADYNTAIELKPDLAEAYYRRGLLYYTTLVDREKALPDFERYLELEWYGPFGADAEQYIADITAELEALEK